MTHHLVGMTEIAQMLGVSRQRVAQIVASYDDFPAPEAELAAGRIWSRTAVETWIQSHPDRSAGRSTGDDVRDAALDALVSEHEAQRKDKRRGMRGAFSFTRMTDRARRSIVLAQENARLLQHNYIGTEHLLLGLLHAQEGIAYEVLSGLDVTLEECKEHLIEMIGAGNEIPRGHIPFTPRSKKVLELSLREALSLGHNYIGTEHILLALIREADGVAWQILAKIGLDQAELRDAVLAALRRPTPDATVSLEDRIKKLEERLNRLEEQ